MMPRPLTPAQRRIGTTPEVMLAGGEHVEPEQVRRAVAAYRAANDLGGVVPDAVDEEANTAPRVEGWIWISICMGGAFFALLVTIYEAASGWYGEAGISVLLALVFTYLAHRVVTEIRERDDKAPTPGRGCEGVRTAGGRGKSNDHHKANN